MRAWLERGADSDGQSIRPVNVITEGPWCRGWANHTEEEEEEEQEQEQETAKSKSKSKSKRRRKRKRGGGGKC